MEKIVYIVHAIDTEGPLYESTKATFERLENTFGIKMEPTYENLEKLRNKVVDLGGKIDFETYLDRIIGVSIVSDSEEEDVHIWISKEQLPYILSKPMHKSQQLIAKYDDGSALISIRVIPNFELIQLLLSFGERVEVRSPLHIREQIKARIENNLRNYQ